MLIQDWVVLGIKYGIDRDLGYLFNFFFFFRIDNVIIICVLNIKPLETATFKIWGTFQVIDGCNQLWLFIDIVVDFKELSNPNRGILSHCAVDSVILSIGVKNLLNNWRAIIAIHIHRLIRQDSLDSHDIAATLCIFLWNLQLLLQKLIFERVHCWL